MFVKTLNITDSVSNIETSVAYKYYWVRNLGAEDVSVFKASADADTNKKIILSQDEYVKIIPENNNIYFKSSSTGTKIEIYGTNTDICPFKAGKVEGSSDGGRTETVLYSANAPHKTNVELSQPYTNFDEIVIIWKYSDKSTLSDYPSRYETTKLTSQMKTDDIIIIWENNILTNAYAVYDSTHLNFVTSQGTYYSYLAKVVGIKY